MPFYLYNYNQKVGNTGSNVVEYFIKNRNISLAGYNAIYNLWSKKNKPINKGWHADLNDLVSIITEGKGNANDHKIIIDFDPKANWRIALIEIINIYAFTYGNQKTGEVWWTPIMLELRDVWVDEELIKPLNPEQKSLLTKNFDVSDRNIEDTIIEFIYLRGDDGGWNFGRVGGANATFISGDARTYFRKFF